MAVSLNNLSDKFAKGVNVCYLLKSLSKQRTYVGFTNHLSNRLRQHNGEIKGGARTTIIGRPWEIAAVVSGFQHKNEALSLEWHIKHYKKGKGLQRRSISIVESCNSFKWKEVGDLEVNATIQRFLTIHWFDAELVKHSRQIILAQHVKEELHDL